MSKSLGGLRILNTRPKNQAQLLTQNIIKSGGISIECPTLEITATNPDWLNSLPNLKNVDYAIFISPNAVAYCFQQMHQKHIHWPTTIKVIAIGQGTANALKEQGISVHDLPKLSDSEHLLALASLQTLKNQTVLLFKGEGGRPLIEEGLLQRGAKVVSLLVYKREMPNIHNQLIESIWRNDRVDIILVTSEQSLNNLFNLFGTEAKNWLQSKIYLVLSDRLAKSASILGIKRIIISHPDRIMDTLFDYIEGLTHEQ